MSTVPESAAAGWHHHQAFGLNIRSRLPLPELAPQAADVPVDVELEVDDVPLELPDATVGGVRFQAAPERLLLRVDGVARYLVAHGRRITIAPDPAGDQDSVRAFLLAQALGALLHQRNDLVLHGSAIASGAGAVAFLGVSGVGKSTTAAAFRRRGCAVLTDDLCVVREGADGRLMIHPGFPQMKLWLDSLEKLDLSADGLRRLRHKIEKRVLPLGDEFATAPQPVKKIYVLHPTAKDALHLTNVDGPRKFRVLKSHTYRFGFLAGIGDKTGHFQLAMKLARQVPLVIAARPEAPFRLEELVDLVEADLRR